MARPRRWFRRAPEVDLIEVAVPLTPARPRRRLDGTSRAAAAYPPEPAAAARVAGPSAPAPPSVPAPPRTPPRPGERPARAPSGLGWPAP